MSYALDMYVGEYREQPFNIEQDGVAWTGMAAVFTGTAKLVMTWKERTGECATVLVKQCTPAPTGTAGEWEVTDIDNAETLITFKLADTGDLDDGEYKMDVWLVRDDGEWVPITGTKTVRLRQGVAWPV